MILAAETIIVFVGGLGGHELVVESRHALCHNKKECIHLL